MTATIKIRKACESRDGFHPTNEIVILPVGRIECVQPFGHMSVIVMDWGVIYAAHSADTIAQMMNGIYVGEV